MSFRFYATTTDAWRAMLAAAREAKSSIYFETFVFVANPKRYDFVSVFKTKARAGVKVKVIIDSFGSFFVGQKSVRELEDAGAEVLFYNRLIPWWNPTRFKYWWFHRNHKKIMIVDEKTAFIGGATVGKKYRKFWELHVELRGVIARYLIKSFVASYKLSGGKDDIKYPAIFRKGKIKIFHHSPLTGRGILKNYYKKSLRAAQKRVIIVTPFFFPQSWLIKLLIRAARRGVMIEIILPHQAEYDWIAGFINYYLAALVYRPNIKFFFTKETIHAKALLVDDREAMVGSQNIDAQSFDYNLEAGIVFERKDMIEKLKKIINQWKSESRELTFANHKKKWYQRLITATILRLTPYL